MKKYYISIEIHATKTDIQKIIKYAKKFDNKEKKNLLDLIAYLI